MGDDAPALPAIPSSVREMASAAYAPPVAHALQAFALQRDHAFRLAAAAVATTELFSRAPGQGGTPADHAARLEDLWDMQSAVRDRFAALQLNWADGWFNWLRYASDVGGANTMAKLAEREYNVAAQAVQLAGAQAEGLFGLLENVEIGYLYWINRKARHS